MQQGRWVSYIFRYRDNERCENAGFIKVQCITHNAGDEARIQIGLRIYKKVACKCMAYLLYKSDRDEQVNAIFLDEIPFLQGERDMIMKRMEVPWSNPYGNGRDFSDYDGILFLCDDGERLLGMWKDYTVLPENIVLEEKAVKEKEKQESVTEELYERLPENMTEIVDVSIEDSNDVPSVDISEAELRPVSEVMNEAEPEAVSEEMSDTEPEAVSEEMSETESEAVSETMSETEQDAASESEDGLSQMLRTYPKIPLFIDSPYLECVKIVPQDIGKLAMSNWKLGENSFLSHGYYHYRYIMLGRVRIKNEEKYVIGVPGVFTNKEKYLANMFGFCLFIPVKNTDYLTGNFGYWLSEISRE